MKKNKKKYLTFAKKDIKISFVFYVSLKNY